MWNALTENLQSVHKGNTSKNKVRHFSILLHRWSKLITSIFICSEQHFWNQIFISYNCIHVEAFIVLLNYWSHKNILLHLGLVGTDATGDLVGRYCGNTTLPVISAPSPSLWVAFVSDQIAVDRGFQFNYRFTRKSIIIYMMMIIIMLMMIMIWRW